MSVNEDITSPIYQTVIDNIPDILLSLRIVFGIHLVTLHKIFKFLRYSNANV